MAALSPARLVPVATCPSPPAREVFIDIGDVSLAYGDGRNGTLALENFSLRIHRGEFAAIVGPSGCGKSTFLKLASGLRLPSGGGVIVAGKEVAGPLKIVGMAFQNAALLPWRTCLKNVMLPFEIVRPLRQNRRRAYAEYREKALTLIRAVGLEDVADRYPWQLSGGMRQRIALCRALVHEPELLLLDEPFSALDAFTREELWDVVHALRRQRNFTAALVTHDLTEAVYLADTVHVLSARPGRIIHSQPIGLPPSREPSDRFTPAFAEMVLSLREKITLARGQRA